MKGLLMKSRDSIILIVILLLLPNPGFAGSTAELPEESESPIHELPRADQCSIITIEIRELSYSLKKVHKEAAHITAASQNGDNEQFLRNYADTLNLLQAREESLREQIDLREQKLKNCLHQTAMPGE